MIFLGVDPGIGETGYAVIETSRASPRVRASGCAKTSSRGSLESRIRAVYEDIHAVFSRWRPEIAVLEGLYTDYGFPRTAILMGHVRGVICLAADQNGARVLEVSPAEVKRAMTGSGRASKDQIRRAVTRMLTLKAPPESEHVCDALALALVGAAREGAKIS